MIGTTIAHYKILSELGRGGMGVVYKAQDLNLDRFVAIKLLLPHLSSNEESINRFVHEAKAASSLDHANIGTLHEVDRTEEGQTFIVMAYYEGETLRERIDRCSMTANEALDIASQIATGLARAHETDIVHRDIKPSNIIITKHGEVKILDFGLAKLAGKTKLTKEGSTVGTAAYMSPEQARGEEVDHRSDIFSLGTILYEMLGGVKPFKGEHEAALLYEIVHEEPKPVSSIREGLPEGMEQVLARCLAKDPSGRYQLAAALRDALYRLKQELQAPTATASAGESAAKAGASGKRWLWAVPVIIIAAAVIIWSPWDNPDDAELGLESLGPARPNWILVAEFDGPGDDPELASTVRELVIATLSESRLVRPLSRPDLKRGLQLAMKPDTTRIIDEVAQELAYRAGARTYIEGTIGKVGSACTIVLNVIDTETGSYVLSISGSAESDNAIITEVDRLGRELREKLGENAASIRATSPAREIITPSFEALQKYMHANRLHSEMHYRLSNKLTKEALALDPDFAKAFSLLGYNYGNLGYDDSAMYYHNEALKRPGRLTERDRLSIDAMIKMWYQRELHEALRIYAVLLDEYDYDHNNHAIVLSFLGREEESFEMLNSYIAARPFGAGDIAYWNLGEKLVELGRYEEARGHYSKMQSPGYPAYFELMIAAAMSDWTKADSIAGSPVFRRHNRVALYFAARALAKGSVRAARRRHTEMWDDYFINFNYQVCLFATIFSAITRCDDVRVGYPVCSDSTMKGLIIQGIHAATTGDSDRAQRRINDIKEKSIYEQRRFALEITMVETYAALAREDRDAVEMHLEIMTADYQPAMFSRRLPIRWVIAEAYEKIGEPERAAECFELVLSPLKLDGSHDFLTRAAYCAYAHQRLVMLYSQMGRAEEARRHFEAFKEMFTDPDPELVWMLEDAREAIDSIKK